MQLKMVKLRDIRIVAYKFCFVCINFDQIIEWAILDNTFFIRGYQLLRFKDCLVG